MENDLISRAALVDDLSYCAPELFFDKDYLLCKIMKQPIIDAAPVVHGRWITFHTGTDYITQCSECNESFYSVSDLDYCPHCGAQMDGDKDDD